MKTRFARRICISLLLFASLGFAGCGPRGTRINLITFDDAGKSSRHYTDFTRASFRRQSDGRIELVFRSQQQSNVDPTQTITQVVYVQSFWTPRLGVSYAESTQINANVQYAILTPPTGVRFDGGAFVSYKIDPVTKEVVGWVESGDLAPAFKMGDAVEPFGPARIYGHFRASDNPGDVVNTVQTLKIQFTQAIEYR